MSADQSFTLALWRRSDCCGIEFFVPNTGYTTMHYAAGDDDNAIAARDVTERRFAITPRGNARIFRQAGGCVVAFCLTTTEANSLGMYGKWLPPVFIDDDAAAELHDLAMRL